MVYDSPIIQISAHKAIISKTHTFFDSRYDSNISTKSLDFKFKAAIVHAEL